MERKLAVWVDIHHHRVAIAELTLQQPHGQFVLQALLDDALERSRAVDRIVALLAKSPASRLGQLQRDLAILEQLAQPSKLDLANLSNLSKLFAAQGAKDDHLIDAVRVPNSLRPEQSPRSRRSEHTDRCCFQPWRSEAHVRSSSVADGDIARLLYDLPTFGIAVTSSAPPAPVASVGRP